MSAYLVTRPHRAIHVGVWVINDSELRTGRRVPVCGQGDMPAWWPALDDEIATRPLCSRCVAVVKQMTTLIEQATT